MAHKGCGYYCEGTYDGVINNASSADQITTFRMFVGRDPQGSIHAKIRTKLLTSSMTLSDDAGERVINFPLSDDATGFLGDSDIFHVAKTVMQGGVARANLKIPEIPADKLSTA